VCPVDNCITMDEINNDNPKLSLSELQDKVARVEMKPIPPHP